MQVQLRMQKGDAQPADKGKGCVKAAALPPPAEQHGRGVKA